MRQPRIRLPSFFIIYFENPRKEIGIVIIISIYSHLPSNIKLKLEITMILPILDYDDVSYFDLNCDLMKKTQQNTC